MILNPKYQVKVESGDVIDEITFYCLKVLRGEIRACSKIKKACRRHIHDFNRQSDPEFPYTFDLESAYRPIRFAGKLRHWEGDWAGKLFEPMLWQKFILGSVFGWRRKSDGKRRYRYAYIEIPRKNGKSFLASVIALYMLVADREEGAQVYALATKRDQAKIVWKSAIKIAKKSGLFERGLSEHWLQLQFAKTNSIFEPLASDSDKLDGLNPHAAFCDELHKWEDRELWDVIEDSFGARSQPLLFSITTAGYNQLGICYQQRTHGESILDGFESGTYCDDTYFVFIADLDPSYRKRKDGTTEKYYDWKNEERWYEANPCLGQAKRLDYMREQCEKAKQMSQEENSFLNKQLDVWTVAAVKWLDLDKWDACNKPVEPAKLLRQPCYEALDLSSNTDLTANVYLFPPGPYPEWAVLVDFYLPEGNNPEDMRKREIRDKVPYRQWIKEGYIKTTPGDLVDLEFIHADVLRRKEEFQIREVGFDPWKAIELATKLQSEGFKMVEMRQGHATLGAPTKELEIKVGKATLRHGGNPVLRWMAQNVVVIKDSNDNIRPDKEKSPQRIDGIVGLIMAIGRAQFGGGVKGKSVYETRGLIEVGGR